MPLEDNAGAEQPQRANAAYATSEDEISLRDLWCGRSSPNANGWYFSARWFAWGWQQSM